MSGAVAILFGIKATLLSNNANGRVAPNYYAPEFTDDFIGLSSITISTQMNYNPLGFRRAFSFSSGKQLTGGLEILPNANAQLSPMDIGLINLEELTGDPEYLETYSNQNNYQAVPSSNPYVTPLGTQSSSPQYLTDVNGNVLTDLTNSPI